MYLLSRLCAGTAIVAAAFTLGTAPAVAQTSASDLRTALGNRADECKAATSVLDANSGTLSRAIGSVYGDGAESAFLALWRKHIGFFVDHTNGLAKQDT